MRTIAVVLACLLSVFLNSTFAVNIPIDCDSAVLGRTISQKDFERAEALVTAVSRTGKIANDYHVIPNKVQAVIHSNELAVQIDVSSEVEFAYAQALSQPLGFPVLVKFGSKSILSKKGLSGDKTSNFRAGKINERVLVVLARVPQAALGLYSVANDYHMTAKTVKPILEGNRVVLSLELDRNSLIFDDLKEHRGFEVRISRAK